MHTNIRQVTIYQPVRDRIYPYIKKKTFSLKEKDEIHEGTGGFIGIKMVDSWQYGHNGDWEDEHESGYKTFKQAQTALIKESKERAKKELNHIKSLKETE